MYIMLYYIQSILSLYIRHSCGNTILNVSISEDNSRKILLYNPSIDLHIPNITIDKQTEQNTKNANIHVKLVIATQ